MKTSLRSLLLTVLVLQLALLALPQAAPAARPGFDTGLAQLADNDTVAMVVIDLDLTEEHVQILAAISSDSLRAEMMKLKELGVEECALVVSLNLPDSRIVLTDAGGATVDALAEKFPQMTVERECDFITMRYETGRETARDASSFDEFEAENAVEIRSLFVTALDSANSYDCKISVAFVAGPDQRRVMEDVLPPMLSAFRDSSGVDIPEFDARDFSANFRWISAGLIPADGEGNLIQLGARLESEQAVNAFAGMVPKLGEIVAALDSSAAMSRVTSSLKFEAEVDGNMVNVASPNQGFQVLMERGSLESRSGVIRNRTRQFAIAMHNYYDAYSSFPPIGSRSEDGRPLLSWRVHILPFIEELELYRQFNLDEPWDSPHNLALVEKMPEIYLVPGSANERSAGLTNFLRPNGNGAMFRDYTKVEFRDITDGTSNTIMIVEVDDSSAVVWTKPQDWDFDPENVANGLGGHIEDRVHFARADGSAGVLSPERLPKEAFTSDAGDIFIEN